MPSNAHAGAGGEQGWSRRRLLTILVSAALVAVLLLLGLALAVREALTTTGTHDQTPPAATGSPAGAPLPTAGPERREAIARAPMLDTGTDADGFRGGTPAPAPAPTMTVPVATTSGPAQVPAGFPRTPEGAVAQLAGIDVTVLAGMSIAQTHQVHQEWTAPGAAPAQDWVMTTNVQSFLSSARQPGQAKEPHVTVRAIPVAGQVKGVDGTDWVLACVLLDVQAVIDTHARIAYGHCEAMQWKDDRWVMTGGPPPAPAPSTWPGTQESIDAGWRTWVPATTDDRDDADDAQSPGGPGVDGDA